MHVEHRQVRQGDTDRVHEYHQAAEKLRTLVRVRVAVDRVVLLEVPFPLVDESLAFVQPKQNVRHTGVNEEKEHEQQLQNRLAAELGLRKRKVPQAIERYEPNPEENRPHRVDHELGVVVELVEDTL